MVEPPFEAGAVKVTVACASPAEAVPMEGASGSFAASTFNEIITANTANKARSTALFISLPPLKCDFNFFPALDFDNCRNRDSLFFRFLESVI